MVSQKVSKPSCRTWRHP